MTRNEKERLHNYFNEMLEYKMKYDFDFYRFVTECFYEEEWWNYDWDNDTSFDYNGELINMASGATRMCLIPEEHNYVLKLEYDCNKINYCNAECEYYQYAREEDIENMFAECFPVIFDINGKIFTGSIMEKIYVDEDYISDKSYEIRLKQSGLSKEEFNNSNHRLDGHQEAKIVMHQEFGDKMFYNLMAFCDTYDINDIHCANLGYDYYGNLKIIDYAGYHGCY